MLLSISNNSLIIALINVCYIYAFVITVTWEAGWKIVHIVKMNMKSKRISGWDNLLLLLYYAGIFITLPSTSNAFTNSKENLIAHAKLSLANQAILPLDNVMQYNGIMRSTVLISASCYQVRL